MVIDPKDIVSFLSWLPSAIVVWFLVVFAVIFASIIVGWLTSTVRNGPFTATINTFLVLQNAVLDIIFMSPRRVFALAYLGMKESIRRRVIIVFVIFTLILLFAGWFLDPGSTEPAKLYLNAVLTITSYLMLLLSLLISALSLPGDLKNRTLQTITTKPVRASEIVLGRILGFMAVGTVLLAVMGTVSYVFVERGLVHTHELTEDDLRKADLGGSQSAVLVGKTSRVNQHRHKVIIRPDGTGRLEMEQGHTHTLTIKKDGGKTRYEIGPAEGMLLARVPVYGKISFLDRSGKPTDKGINVGDEWTYRSYIEGGSLAAFVWTFDGITESRFPNGLPVEMSIGVFRSHKGNIEKGVLGSLSVRNPSGNSKPVLVRDFESKEFTIDLQFIPRQFEGPDRKKYDLFKDFVNDGKLEIWLQCVDSGQYFGAAQADLYLRAADASFALNFAKGYFSIWLQMLLVISLGVAYSTFLSGPVAMLATLGTLLGGFFNDFMYRLATGQTYGGGPFESLIRILTQQNVTSEMEPGLLTTVAQSLDMVAKLFLWVISQILPDFSRFSFSDYVAYGFNISGDTILIFTCRALAFAVPVFIAGYLCLKNREIAK